MEILYCLSYVYLYVYIYIYTRYVRVPSKQIRSGDGFQREMLTNCVMISGEPPTDIKKYPTIVCYSILYYTIYRHNTCVAR